MKNGLKIAKGGFTIVELLVVIAIISILAGAITMGVNGMFYKSRMGRAKAMRTMLQSGIEMFYARTGEWPDAIQKLAENSDQDSVLLSDDAADRCFREIVRISVGANAKPVIDPSGLFVAKGVQEGCTDIHKSRKEAERIGVISSGAYRCNGRCARGRDFTEATKRGSPSRITLNEMNFGYQGPNHGRFCRFRLYYYPKSDTVKVLLQPATEIIREKYPNGFTDD